mgnify:CR=1 FL=1
MPIPPTLLLTHRILLEYTIEHIRAIDLTRQVSIIPGIIPADEMSKGSLSITPIGFETEFFGTFDAGDLGAELVVHFRELEGFGFGVRGGRVDRHVEDAEVELAEVEEGVVDVLDGDLFLDEIVSDLLAGEVVVAEGFELGGGPAPVLQHLGGGFDEIADD